MKTWSVTIILDSLSTNKIASYSHGAFVDQLDWERDLARFEKKEKFRAGPTHLVVCVEVGS